MTNLFRNSSPGALTLRQSVEQAKKRLVERGLQMRKARELAAQGRGGDTEVAHVAPGEIVLPKALQTSNVLSAIRQAAQEANIPFNQLRIGSPANSINPETGMPEFGLLSGIGDWFLKTFGVGEANAEPVPTSSPTPVSTSSEDGAPDPAPMEEIIVPGSLITDDPSTNKMIESLHPSLRYDAAKFINDVKDRHGLQLRIPTGEAYRTIENRMIGTRLVELSRASQSRLYVGAKAITITA